MINFKLLNNSEPYKIFKSFYDKAHSSNQESIEAVSISSYETNSNEVNSRYVNLKYIDDEDWVFFTNYESPKANQFKSHNQVACIFFWNRINLQIRIKATIKKIDPASSDDYFKKRDEKKNALAIASSQSEKIDSYESVLKKYDNIVNDKINLSERPAYWGGYSFTPYYFEFWEGQSARINKRVAFYYDKSTWYKNFLQP